MANPDHIVPIATPAVVCLMIWRHPDVELCEPTEDNLGYKIVAKVYYVVPGSPDSGKTPRSEALYREVQGYLGLAGLVLSEEISQGDSEVWVFLPKIALSPEEIIALGRVKEGADVYSWDLAETLRRLDHRAPGLVNFTEPMTAQGPAYQRQAYFGAAVTESGRRLLRARLQGKSHV